MQELIIDRFEGSYAVCENADKSFVSIPKYKLPLESKEGDCLLQGEDGIYRIATVVTKDKQEKSRNKSSRLFE